MLIIDDQPPDQPDFCQWQDAQVGMGLTQVCTSHDDTSPPQLTLCQVGFALLICRIANSGKNELVVMEYTRGS